MKNILCAFSEPDCGLLEEIYIFGKKHHWQIEQCGRQLPVNWFGDGVLTDYLQAVELRQIRNFSRTPIIAREFHREKNIWTVAGDTRQIATMVAEYFIGKGYSRFAAIDSREWPGNYNGIPQDLVKAFQLVLSEHGFSLEICHWKPDMNSDERINYATVIPKLEQFFRRLPKPVALLIPNSHYLAITYRVLAAARIKVPEEVAILCNTDSSMMADNALIPTTRISGELREVGRKMADLLHRIMIGETVSHAPVFVTSAAIVSRRSTDTLAVPDLRLATAISFLLANYMNFISVVDAAHEAGISASMLNRKFRRYLGISPQRFLLELRLNRIRELLDNTELSLSKIAKQTGYGSSMALSSAFKRETGMTPGTYRQSRRSGQTSNLPPR